MNPILSIIVPSYNTSRFVDECLPTYIDTRLEGLIKVLLIDDGATDDTSLKASKYVSQHPNIFQFYHKENGGHGSVINYGVHNLVKTKYFKVVDGDDWVDTSELVKLCAYLTKCDDDVVCSNYIESYTTQTNFVCGVLKKDKQSLQEINNFNFMLHSTTYKTSLFVDNKIYLREKVFYEDNEYRAFPIKYIRTFSYCDATVYYYRLGDPNQSVSASSIKKHYKDIVSVFDDLVTYYDSFVKEVKDDNKLSLLQNIICSVAYFSHIFISFEENREARSELLQLDKKIRSRKELFKAIKRFRKIFKLLIICRYHCLTFFRKRFVK